MRYALDALGLPDSIPNAQQSDYCFRSVVLYEDTPGEAVASHLLLSLKDDWDILKRIQNKSNTKTITAN